MTPHWPFHVPAALRARWRAEGGWRDRTLGDVLDATAGRHPQRIALVDRNHQLTYSQVVQQTDRLARHLHDVGLGRGDVVSVQLPNCVEFALIHFALARIGAVLSTMHMPYRQRDVELSLSFSRSRAVVVVGSRAPFDFVAMVQGMRGAVPALQHVLAVGDTADARDGTISLGELLRADPCGPEIDLREQAPGPDDPFLLLFTSGTQANPKGVVHSHNTMVSNGAVAAEALEVRETDVLYSSSPMTHAFGLFPLYLALHAGATLAMLEQFSAEAYPDLARRRGVTYGFLVPAQAIDLLRHLGDRPADLPALRQLLVSGTKCPPDVIRRLHTHLGCSMAQLWGMTELEAGTFTRPADPLEAIATTVGRPYPGSEIAIVDPERRPLPNGTVGEVAFRGPSLCLGYFDNPEATDASRSPEGWFYTGDLGRLGPNGYLQLLGRTKDVIDRGGVKYNPVDIEELVLLHPSVAQVAIVGMPDARLGERACAFVVPNGAPPSLPDLCAHLDRHGVARFKHPERLEIVPELPMTPTRKVQKAVLRRRIAEKIQSDPAEEE